MGIIRIINLDDTSPSLEGKGDPKIVNLAERRAQKLNDQVVDMLETGGTIQLPDANGTLVDVVIKGLD